MFSQSKGIPHTLSIVYISFIVQPLLDMLIVIFLQKVFNKSRKLLKIIVLSRKQVLYHGVFNLFPRTCMCVEIDFRLLSD